MVWAIAKGWVGLRYEPGRNMQTTRAQLLDGLYGGNRVSSGITKKTMMGIIGKCLGFADEYATKLGLLRLWEYILGDSAWTVARPSHC